jgi:hypothetical protein
MLQVKIIQKNNAVKNNVFVSRIRITANLTSIFTLEFGVLNDFFSLLFMLTVFTETHYVIVVV